EWLSVNTERGLRSWAKLVYSQFAQNGTVACPAQRKDPQLFSYPANASNGKPRVNPRQKDVNLLFLLTDAFGGRGGIAKFNRDLLNALCTHRAVTSVTALPRVICEDPGQLPANLVYPTEAASGKTAYLFNLGRLLAQRNDFAAVICGHIHLL